MHLNLSVLHPPRTETDTWLQIGTTLRGGELIFCGTVLAIIELPMQLRAQIRRLDGFWRFRLWAVILQLPSKGKVRQDTRVFHLWQSGYWSSSGNKRRTCGLMAKSGKTDKQLFEKLLFSTMRTLLTWPGKQCLNLADLHTFLQSLLKWIYCCFEFWLGTEKCRCWLLLPDEEIWEERKRFYDMQVHMKKPASGQTKRFNCRKD